jgi:hypothetical protein
MIIFLVIQIIKMLLEIENKSNLIIKKIEYFKICIKECESKGLEGKMWTSYYKEIEKLEDILHYLNILKIKENEITKNFKNNEIKQLIINSNEVKIKDLVSNLKEKHLIITPTEKINGTKLLYLL